MKTKLGIIIVLLTAGVLRAQNTNLTMLLQQGLFEEQANRNLPAAIANYETLAAQFDKDRQLAATAIFRLGECYRAQGKTNEAAAQYQRIVHEFPDQQMLATLSVQNLTGLGITPKTPPAAPANDTGTLDGLKGQYALLKAQLDQARKETNAEVVAQIFSDAKDLGDNLRTAASLVQSVLQEPRNDEEAASLRKQPEFRQLEQELAQSRKKLIDYEELRLKILQEAVRQGEGVESTTNAIAEEGRAWGVVDDEDRQIERYRKLLENSPDLFNAIPHSGFPPLINAAWNGDLRVAAFLLDHGANVNLDCRGASSLSIAAGSGRKTMVELLLNHGADINWNNDLALCNAAEEGFQAVVQTLMAHHADVNGSGREFPLAAAVKSGQSALVKMILDAGADPNHTNTDGESALGFAVWKKSPEIAKMLLESGANPNVGIMEPRPPREPILSYAIDNDLPEVVPMLLAAHADPNAGPAGSTPLALAVAKGDLSIVQLLLNAKADPNKSTIDGRSVLFRAVDHPDLLKALLDAGAEVDPRGGGDADWTPLGLAARNNYLEAAEILLKHGANPNVRSRGGETPLAIAIDQDLPNVVKILLEGRTNGVSTDKRSGDFLKNEIALTKAKLRSLLVALPADDPEVQVARAKLALYEKKEKELEHGFTVDPNESRLHGESLLFSALRNTEILEELLKAGAEVDPISHDETQWTPLGAAVRNGYKPAVEILLKYHANPNVRNRNGVTPLHWAAYNPKPDREIFALLLDHEADPNIASTDGKTPLDELKHKLADENASPEKKALIGTIIDWLHERGARDKLPNWSAIQASRPSANYLSTVFQKDTNDWNHFTVLQALLELYESSKIEGFYPLPNSQNTASGPGVKIIWPNSNSSRVPNGQLLIVIRPKNPLPFPDLSHLVIIRPIRNSTNETRITVNLLHGTDGVDCSKDVPLQFGDVIQIPECDHSLGETPVGLTDQQRDGIFDCLKGSVQLRVRDQNVELPLLPIDGGRSTVSAMLKQSEAQQLLLASSDLSHIKIIRHDQSTGKIREFVVDSNADLWLRNGDLIEVPEKSR